MTKNAAAAAAEASKVVALHAEGALRHVGMDDGHFGFKLVTDDWQQFYLDSRVVRGADLISLGDSEDNVYETETGELFAVSPTLPFIETTFAEYALSDMNRVLVHHALVKAGMGGQRVNLVTGLPVSDYFVANKPNSDFIQRKVNNLLGRHITNKNDSVVLARIERHNVVSEAIAAFFDLLFDKEGNQNAEIADLVANGAIGIADVGGKTTDSAVIINGGTTVDGRRSGTDNLGGLSLHKSVDAQLKHHFKVSSLTPAKVDEAVRTGKLKLFGKFVDCAEIVEEEKAQLAKQIVAAIQRKMLDGADLERVYFVGGGAELLRDHLKGLFPHGEIVDDPQFANARGMLKAAKFLQPN
ncbi:ParM/StbA family protein [Ralstonia sp. ASV6]|uniref:ParM/StbA family protein n=1 Tax=Ralstonia sp. ASV6 TaxID=2795124 RepID=UPI0018ED52EE|nr:ParM/StbA family protein [Ralstonia sp. ASV6]